MDADNHYYDQDDTFARRIEPTFFSLPQGLITEPRLDFSLSGRGVLSV
jgi:hypothetical protein